MGNNIIAELTEHWWRVKSKLVVYGRKSYNVSPGRWNKITSPKWPVPARKAAMLSSGLLYNVNAGKGASHKCTKKHSAPQASAVVEEEKETVGQDRIKASWRYEPNSAGCRRKPALPGLGHWTMRVLNLRSEAPAPASAFALCLPLVPLTHTDIQCCWIGGEDCQW